MVKVDILIDKGYQTITKFALPMHWAAQYTGLWPENKRRKKWPIGCLVGKGY